MEANNVDDDEDGSRRKDNLGFQTDHEAKKNSVQMMKETVKKQAATEKEIVKKEIKKEQGAENLGKMPKKRRKTERQTKEEEEDSEVRILRLV